MKDVNFYLDEAKKNSGAKSDRRIAEMCGLGANAASFWRVGKALPSDETMVRLAKIAKINPLIALLDLNIMRSEGAARNAYIKIYNGMQKTLHTALFAMIFVLSASNAQITLTGGELTYQIPQYTLSH